MAMPSRNHLLQISGILIACFLAAAFQLLLSLSSTWSSFGPLEIPSPSSTLQFPSNSKLQEVIKLGEDILKKPEAVAVDGMGILYTATRDGWIRRLLKNGTWEDWQHVDSDGLLGLTFTETGDLIVCDADKALLKIGEKGVTVLATHVNGEQIRLADDVAASSSGKLYFSLASTRFDFHHGHLDMLEPMPSGQLVEFDPSTGTSSILLDHLGFANGVALSENQDYLVVCETWKFRCLKYVLKGEDTGKTEIFIENLPGAPDNINLAPDGSFWIALIQIRPSRWLRYLPKYVMEAFPNVIELGLGIYKKAMVVNVGGDGNIIRGFDDPTGEVMPMVTSALEFEGNLYLGSMKNDFLGKLPLTSSSA